MSVKQFAAGLKATIEGIKAKGTAAIECDSLIAYLDQVINTARPEPTGPEIEEFKAELQRRADESKQRHEADLEMFRSVIGAGGDAIRAAFLLNGGAAVAMLAFLGHLAEFEPSKVPAFASTLLIFSLGVFAAALTSGGRYLSQWFYADDRPICQKTGFTFNIACIVIGFSSYFFFLWAVLDTYKTFISYVSS